MTTQDNAANAFEQWREMFQKSTEAWAQAAGSTGSTFWPPFFGAAPGNPAPGFGFPVFNMPGFNVPGFGQMPGSGPMPGGNPFGQFMPPSFLSDVQQVWQQFYDSWAEQAQQAMASGTPGPEALLNAQKQWTEQLEAMAKTFAEVMGTEAYANLLGRYMEQSLVWQVRAANAAAPQLDAMLKSYNLPSRSQIDRMFEHVIGLEDRIDDLEDENRKLRAQVEAALRAPTARSRGRSPEQPTAE